MVMRSVSYETYFAAFGHGLIKGAGGRKHIPERSVDIPAYGSVIAGSSARIEEWIAGDPPEVIARKVLACQSAEYWLRADLADAAQLRIAEAAEESRRVIREVNAWSLAQDQANAESRGMSLEAYRRLRNAQMNRQVARSGVNSRGMR